MFFRKKPTEPKPEQIQHLMQLFASGQLDALIEEAEQLATQFPKTAQIHNILSVAYNAAGDHYAAVDSAEQAIRIQPDYTKAFLNLGNALANMGDHDHALESYRQAVHIDPEFSEGHLNLGSFLHSIHCDIEALEHLESAIRLKPGYFKAYNNLGHAQMEIGLHDEAIANLEKAIELKPDYAEAYSNLGCAQLEISQYDAGIANMEKAIELKPDYAAAYNNLAGALLDIGRKGEATECFSHAIELDPAYAEAYRQLANLITFSEDQPVYRQMRACLASGKLTDAQQMHLCFGLAKAEDDMGNVDASFQFLKQANQLRCDSYHYDIEEDRNLFQRIRQTFSVSSPEQAIQAPDDSRVPIFVLGMPRSGTTLVEQILASHSMVYGAGEVPALHNAVNKMGWDTGRVDTSQLQFLRKNYFDWMQGLNSSAKCITDKTTLNFLWIGFIIQALPEAKIVHIKRDPIATCWSIFRLYFETGAHGYGYDMNSLTEYYKMYQQLMAFWEEKFPGRIHHIQYETLTENQGEETRKLLEYCGLAWEEQCMDFHLSKRAVATASNQQVRQKMYQGSSAAWRKYAAHLQPVIKQLEGL